jgi:hypothetical protein
MTHGEGTPVQRSFYLHQKSCLRYDFELTENEKIVATLEHPSLFSFRGVATIGAGDSWLFLPKGILRFDFEIRQAGSELPIANYSKYFFKKYDILMLPMGEIIYFRQSYLRREITALDEQEKPLFSLRRSKYFKLEYNIDVFVERAIEKSRFWLVLFACHLAIAQSKRHSTSG